MKINGHVGYQIVKYLFVVPASELNIKEHHKKLLGLWFMDNEGKGPQAQATFASIMGVSAQTIKNYFDKLVEVGLLEEIERTSARNYRRFTVTEMLMGLASDWSTDHAHRTGEALDEAGMLMEDYKQTEKAIEGRKKWKRLRDAEANAKKVSKLRFSL